MSLEKVKSPQQQETRDLFLSPVFAAGIILPRRHGTGEAAEAQRDQGAAPGPRATVTKSRPSACSGTQPLNPSTSWVTSPELRMGRLMGTYLAFGGREGFILLLPFTAQDPGRLPPWPLHRRVTLGHHSIPLFQCHPGRWENGGVPEGRVGTLPKHSSSFTTFHSFPTQHSMNIFLGYSLALLLLPFF